MSFGLEIFEKYLIVYYGIKHVLIEKFNHKDHLV